MAQAATLTDTQLRRVLQYVSTRRHALRDRTIMLVSFNAGLRAKEIASLVVGDIYDAAGSVREQFILRRAQTKGGYERTVYLNKTLRRAMLPALVIAGEHDPVAPVRRQDFTAQLMPHGKLVTIPDAGSLPTLEQPEAVTAAIEAFLAGPMMLRTIAKPPG